MTTLLTLILLGYVIYLDRRVDRLNRQLSGALGAGGYAEECVEPSEAEFSAAHEVPTPAQQVVDYAAVRPAAVEPPAEIWSEEAEPYAEVEEPQEASRTGFGFEELFGRRLPIWAGGITLAIAGMLIVKLSIEAGLLSPVVRVICGTIFGFVLIAGAEAALRNQARVRDVRVRQALSGAGIASLYASILIAANLYGLIPPLLAMTGAAAVTALAMFLAVRFGAPSALLGLAGGLAAPALIGSSTPNVPLLTLYLALAVGGLATLSRSQRWAWLGVSALVGGFGWGLVLLAGGALDVPGSIAMGLYILLLGIGLPSLGLAGNRSEQLQVLAGMLAAAQMAALVATGGFAFLNWGLFALIAVATVWLANRDPAIKTLPPVGMGIGLLLLAAWPNPDQREFVLALSGTLLIFGAMPLKRVWSERGGLLDAAQLAALSLCGWLLPMLQLHRGVESNDVPLGLLAAGFAVVAAGIAEFGWRNDGRRDDARFTILSVTAAVLAAAAASLLAPEWLLGVAIAAIGFALLELGQRSDDPRLEPFAWIFAIIGLIAFTLPDASFSNSTAVDSARFALMTLVAALFAWRGGYPPGRGIAQFLGPLLLYGTLAPLLPDVAEPFIAPLTLLALAWTGQRFALGRMAPAMAAAALIVLMWAGWPLLEWGDAALTSLMAEPVLMTDVPSPSDALRRLLLPGLMVGIAAIIALPRLQVRERYFGLILAGTLAAVALHSLYKQLFAIGSGTEFAIQGLAERTAWELLLVAAAAGAMRFGKPMIALALAATGAAHLALYTLLLHNPLWAAQHVGNWPLLNLLVPVYGLALGLTLAATRLDCLRAEVRRAISVAQMLLIVLFAFSMLRQLFHGSLLVGPGLGQAEDIGRSILAIVLAFGFLVWGIVREDKLWRLASLALMLGAVAKVFLFDASGLEGVTRIASFVALGFSLIGIGWLYARFLPSGDRTAPALA